MEFWHTDTPGLDMLRVRCGHILSSYYIPDRMHIPRYRVHGTISFSVCMLSSVYWAIEVHSGVV